MAKMKSVKKKLKKFNKLLNKYIKRKDFIKIYRDGADGPANISGFILQTSKHFLLLQVEEEFYLDGYAIIRTDRFDSIRLSETEIFQKKVLKKEGILKSDLGLKQRVELKSWETIFTDLQEKDYFAIVECEDLKKSTFCIGEIAKIGKKSVGIRYFTPSGIIEKKPTKIKYTDITCVRFNDRYTNMYRKYLKEEKK